MWVRLPPSSQGSAKRTFFWAHSTRGLGHQTLILKTAVRIRYGLPNFQIPNSENQRVRDFSFPKLPLLCQPRVNVSRERFNLNKNQSVMASRILADTFEKGLIKTGCGAHVQTVASINDWLSRHLLGSNNDKPYCTSPIIVANRCNSV